MRQSLCYSSVHFSVTSVRLMYVLTPFLCMAVVLLKLHTPTMDTSKQHLLQINKVKNSAAY